MNTKSYKVVINGEEYNLVSDEGEARIAQAAQMVDEAIEQLSSQIPGLDRRKIAVLAALQITNSLLQNQDAIAQPKEQQNKLATLLDQKLLSL